MPAAAPTASRFRRYHRSAFTLLELLVVIAIIAILAGLVAPEILSNTSDAKTQAARSQIEMLGLALDSYRLHTGDYPTTEQGLSALRTMPTTGDIPRGWRGPYLRRIVPLDSWERPYVYMSPGTVNPGAYDLFTLGRDAAPGGGGEDRDITSWGDTVVTTGLR
ncbi:MAG: type II secretion system major pseudopilin GspG [Gemmatimonadaceae bacterium]